MKKKLVQLTVSTNAAAKTLTWPSINICKYQKPKKKKRPKRREHKNNMHHITKPVESVQTTNEFTILTKFGLFFISVGMSDICL